MSLSVWNKDKKKIVSAFYECLDLGAIIDGINRIQNKTPNIDDSLPKKWSYVASGRHFEVYKFAGRSLSYAVKISKFDLFHHDDHRLFIDFKKKMQNLKKANCYLVPPFEVLEINPGIVLLQPFADQSLDEVDSAYMPISTMGELVRENIRAHGFAIKDILQFRCWNHVPILVDFSDLVKTP